jgi:XTP/dITP diphosphohydrolase
MNEKKEHTLVFATNNPNKLKEVQLLLPSHIKLLSLKDINCLEDIPETAHTIEGNAILKVEWVKSHYKLDCFADDPGLEVDALGGSPGVYSARYSGDNATSDKNIDKVLHNLKLAEDRSARFKTVIAMTFKGTDSLFEGICEGSITNFRRGEKGFGYDPIFLPTESTQTFAEMPLEEKSRVGHRGKAMRLLIEYFSQYILK